MIKAHQRRHSGWMRRSSRIYLNSLNKGKKQAVARTLLLLANVIRYFIAMFWSKNNFSACLEDKKVTDKAVKRFGITARMAQLAAKQAKEIVRSQRKKSKRKRKMPRFKNITITLDSRFFTLSQFKGHFDLALKLSSGFPLVVIPFKHTKHTKKFLKDGWTIGNSIRLGLNGNILFLDLIFEKPKPALREEGDVLGIDRGFRYPLATSEGELLGGELREKVVKAGKRRKRFHEFVESELNREVKSLSLEGVQSVVIENLKHVKRGKRGKFPRKVNRFLSFWQYAKVGRRLKQLCEELGIRLEVKDPYKTSQRCPACGNIDRKNRNGERFNCTRCGFTSHADVVGAVNLKLLGLAGVYSLRSLKTQGCGNIFP